ncbi:MAG: hypothetical protein ACRD1T_08160 [Acidimicrobiia bacterium]
MPSDLPQRKALKFLTDRLQSQEPFTKHDLGNATGWSGSTLDTHWSKHFKPFVVVIGGGRYRVSEGFRPFVNWRKFQRHVTQTRPVAADYARLAYDNVVMYEFFMPLTNETALRTTLDALFFKDNIIPKLRAIGAEKLSQHLSIKDGEAAEKYFERICDWIDSHFVGYSVYHVDGRFRASKLATREQVAEIEKKGQRYLVDETTAVSRFIFPCVDNEADLVRYFFDALFVQAIIQLINAEDEIWMVESGMKNRVHIWRVPGGNDDGNDLLL